MITPGHVQTDAAQHRRNQLHRRAMRQNRFDETEVRFVVLDIEDREFRPGDAVGGRRLGPAGLPIGALNLALKRRQVDPKRAPNTGLALDADGATLKALASAIVERPGYVVILVSSTSPALVAVARSSDLQVASNKVLAMLTDRFGGRGGGRPEFAQGGGLDAATDDILAAARMALTSAP